MSECKSGRLLPGLLLLVAFLLAGCGGGAGHTSFQAWLEKEPRVVLLVVEPPVGEGVYRIVETRYGAAAAAGAGAGAVGWLEAGGSLSGCTGEAAIGCLIIWVAVFPFVVVGGAIVGAASAEPVTIDSWALAAAEQTRPVAAVFAERLPETGDRIVEALAAALREDGRHRVIVVAPGDSISDATDARIELKLHTAEILAGKGEDPKVRLLLRTYVKATWDRGIENRNYEYQSARENLSSWTATDSPAPAKAFEEGANFLAGRIVGRLVRPPPGADPHR